MNLEECEAVLIEKDLAYDKMDRLSWEVCLICINSDLAVVAVSTSKYIHLLGKLYKIGIIRRLQINTRGTMVVSTNMTSLQVDFP